MPTIIPDALDATTPADSELVLNIPVEIRALKSRVNALVPGLATGLAFATFRSDSFVGDGATTSFELTEDPVVLGNLDVSVDGLTLAPTTDYTLDAGWLEFTVAPALGAKVLARYGEALPPGIAGSALDISYTPLGTGNLPSTVEAKLREFVSLSDYDTLRNALAVGQRVLVPVDITSIAVSTADSPYVLPQLDRIDPEGPLTISLTSGVHTTTSGNIINVGQNQNITVEGAEPFETTLSSVVSVGGASQAWSVVLNVADATGIATGDYLKIDEVRPLPMLAGDSGFLYGTTPKTGEIFAPRAHLGYVTTVAGASTASLSSGDATVTLADGDLLTVKGQTREITGRTTSSVTISGTWTLGTAIPIQDYYITKPNAGTVTAAASATVTGTSTTFLTAANVGDMLLADGQLLEILAVTNNLSLALSHAVTITAGSKYSIITSAVLHEGMHEVTAVASNQVTVTNKSWKKPPVNKVSGGAVRALKTVLKNTGTGDGIYCNPGASLTNVDNVAIVTTAGTTGTHGIAANGRYAVGPTQLGSTSSITLDFNVGFSGWGRSAFIGMGCSFNARGVAFCDHKEIGVWLFEGAFANMRKTVISGGDGTGLQINAGAQALVTDSRLIGIDGDGGRVLDGGTVYGEIPFVNGCDGMGWRLYYNAGFHFAAGMIAGCTLSGVYSVAGIGDVSGCVIAGNGRDSLELLKNTTLDATATWITGGHDTGRGVYAETADVTLVDAAITGHEGFGIYATHISTLHGNSAYIQSNVGGGYFADGSRGNFLAGSIDTVTAATGSVVRVKDVSPAPTVTGVSALNIWSNAGAFVTDEAGTSTGFKDLSIDGGETFGFLRRGTVVHDFPSIAAGAQAFLAVTVTGATTTNMTALVNSNSLPAGLVLTAGVYATDTVRIYLTNPTGSAIDPGNATYSWAVLGL